MANITEIIITTIFDEDKAIDFINKETGIALTALSYNDFDKFEKKLTFNIYGFKERCYGGDEKLKSIIDAFNKAPFDYPEYVSMIIYDDDTEMYDGTYTLPKRV